MESNSCLSHADFLSRSNILSLNVFVVEKSAYWLRLDFKKSGKDHGKEKREGCGFGSGGWGSFGSLTHLWAARACSVIRRGADGSCSLPGGHSHRVDVGSGVGVGQP